MDERASRIEVVPAGSHYGLCRITVSAQKSSALVSVGLKPTARKWDEVGLVARTMVPLDGLPRSEADMVRIAIEVLQQFISEPD